MNSFATVYFSNNNGSSLVASMHVNEDGIGYEQDDVQILPVQCTLAELGESVKQALSRFSQKSCNLRLRKKTDWPAFRASGLSSIARFEREFTPMSVAFLNSSGAVARAELYLTEEGDTGIFTIFNPRLSGEDIGRRLVALRETYASVSKT